MKALVEYWSPYDNTLYQPTIWVEAEVTDETVIQGGCFGRLVTKVFHESEGYYPKVGQFLFSRYILSESEVTEKINKLQAELDSLKYCQGYLEELS